MDFIFIITFLYWSFILLSCFRWRDKKDVLMINSVYPHSMDMTDSRKPVLKPSSIINYNMNMGAVDHSDKVTKPFVTERKTVKWYKKVYFHLVDLAVYNSYIVWRSFDPTRSKSYETFILKLVHEILEKNHQERKKIGRPLNLPINVESTRQQAGNLGHLPIKELNAGGKPKYVDCKLCSGKPANSSSGNKENKEVRHVTPYKCKECNVNLCIQGPNSCFLQYHKVAELPQKKRSRKRSRESRDSEEDEEEVKRRRRESRYFSSSP